MNSHGEFFSAQAVKKDDGEHPVSQKPKRTKKEITEARVKKKEDEEKSRWRWWGKDTHIQTQTTWGGNRRAFTHFFSIILLSVRWEEEKYEDGVKWKFLEHNGPFFPPEYQPLPDNVHFYYAGQWSTEVKCVRKGD